LVEIGIRDFKKKKVKVLWKTIIKSTENKFKNDLKFCYEFCDQIYILLTDLISILTSCIDIISKMQCNDERFKVKYLETPITSEKDEAAYK